MGHTKAPWKIEPINDGADKTIKIKGDTNFYADRVFCVVDHDDCDHEEAKANARLIAASPEMYAALKRMRRLMAAYEHWNACRYLDRIIAKAEGTDTT